MEEADLVVATAVSMSESLVEKLKVLGMSKTELGTQLEFATMALTGCRTLRDQEIAKVAGPAHKESFIRMATRSAMRDAEKDN